MKKKIIIIVGIILLAIIGVTSYILLTKKTNDSLVTITGRELLDKINKKETFILVMTQKGCSHCEEYKPVINRVLSNHNLVAYELNLTEMKSEDEAIRQEVNQLFNVNGTPTTIFINDGVEKTVLNRIAGSSTASNLEKVFKERGFIK